MTIPTPDLARFGLLGFGTMGSGIAQVLAASGRDVLVLETETARIDAGFARVASSLDGGIRRGKLGEDEKARVLGRIAGTTKVSDLQGVDAVLESVTEDAEVKLALLAEVASIVGAEVPLLTNTSALSVTAMAADLPNPARVAGLHFFNPAPVMRSVEVVAALQTDPDLIDRLIALVNTLDDKIAVPVADRPGFLLNALLLPYLNDVINEYDDGLASAEDLDVALELGLGYRTGPLKMLYMIGLDVHLQATEAVYQATNDPRYAAPPLLRRMVAAGQLGTKSGSSFRGPEPESNGGR